MRYRCIQQVQTPLVACHSWPEGDGFERAREVRGARNGGLCLSSEGEVYWIREGQVCHAVSGCADCGEGRVGEDQGYWEVDCLASVAHRSTWVNVIGLDQLGWRILAVTNYRASELSAMIPILKGF